MEGILRVTLQDLLNTAQEFMSTGTKVQGYVGEIDSIVSTLRGVWEGDAATAFYTKYENLKNGMDARYRMIAMHVEALNDIEAKYNTTEDENASTAEALSGDVLTD